jgi:hypothetical protein
VFEGILKQWLLWKQPLLLDISIQNIHTFSLELHLDGGYLSQGYQSVYTAMWWQALTDEPMMLSGMRTEEPIVPDGWDKHKAKALEHRQIWGSGNKLSMEQIYALLTGIAKMLGAGQLRSQRLLDKTGTTLVDRPWKIWTPEVHEIFISLPFYAGQSPDVTIGTVRAVEGPSTSAEEKTEERLGQKPPGLLAVDITIFQIDNLPAAYHQFNIDGGSISDAILRQVYQQMVTLSSKM